MEVLDRQNIRIEIWERGAGYTLASGSSSTAAAAVAYRLDLCDPDITVHMPGGDLAIRFLSRLCRHYDRAGDPCLPRCHRFGNVSEIKTFEQGNTAYRNAPADFATRK